MTTIYLARHAESDWNAENRFQGHTDRPLTEGGRAQAEALADELADKPLEAVFSSPLHRALDTAKLVAARHDLPAIYLPPKLSLCLPAQAGNPGWYKTGAELAGHSDHAQSCGAMVPVSRPIDESHVVRGRLGRRHRSLTPVF